MRPKPKHIILNIVTVFAVTMFFSCKNNFKEVQQMGLLQNQPIGEAEGINLKYTESEDDSLGKIVANLKSPKMLDYSNRDFSFSEFPEGINLTLYDKEGGKNVVISDYAIVYNQTDLIDLRGNVILITKTKDTLFADQMYYDQRKEWLFTNQAVKLRSSQSNSGAGNIFDSDTEFKNMKVSESSGVGFVKD